MSKKVIGMATGGQLARMLTQAADKLGFGTVVLDPTPDCPAHQAGAEQIVGDARDSKKLLELGAKSDYLTIEFEHIDASVLEKIAEAIPVNPSPKTIRLIQDKYEQKKFLRDNGFPTADFVEINSLQEAKDIFKKWGRMVLKSKTEAYDGKGNVQINELSQIEPAMEKFAPGVYAEKFVNFRCELAVMAAKDMRKNVAAYPIVETVHKRNICVEVYAPAQLEQTVSQKAGGIAKRLVSKLEGAGVYGIEMFLDENWEVLINEIAPRVHNSGHYTMDSSKTSQFEQHIRAVTGQVLGDTASTAKACCMVNILGEREGPAKPEGIEEAQKIPGVSVYIYGKTPTKVDRKMGHINALAGTMEEAKANARRARQLIRIS